MSRNFTPHRPHLDILIAATRGKDARWVKIDRVHRLFVVPHHLHRFHAHVARCPTQDPENLSYASNATATAPVLLQKGFDWCDDNC